MTFLAQYPIKLIFPNSSVLLEYLAMLLTSTLVINCQLSDFLNKAIGIINPTKLFFLTFPTNTLIWYLSFNVGLKSLLRVGLSEPGFYGDLVYKLKTIVGSYSFSAHLDIPELRLQ